MGVAADVAVVAEGVPAVHVVDIAVAVVVDAVRARGLSLVDPDVRVEVGVADLAAAVDDRADEVAAPGAEVPRVGRVDVGVGRPSCEMEDAERVRQHVGSSGPGWFAVCRPY